MTKLNEEPKLLRGC